MNYPLQEDLLGYVLGALDATEERDIQQKIEQDPNLQDQVEHIRKNLLPLEALDSPTGMRPGMARRTCEWVAGVDKDPGFAQPHQIEDTDHIANFADAAFDDKAASIVSAPDAGAKNARVADVDHDPSVTNDTKHSNELLPMSMEQPDFQWLHPVTWSMTDALTGVAVLAVLACILFPTLSYQRFHSQVAQCENNLNQIGNAMLQYSDINDGKFVEIPAEGRLSASGYFAPALKDAGLIEDDKVFSCAGVDQETPVHIPSIDQIKFADDNQVDHLRRTMSGNYGYSMGYQNEDKYQPLSNRGLTNTVLVADMPSLNQPGRLSNNHGTWGQNCLFGDGHVEFIRGDSVGEDAIFVNDYGLVAPGTSEHDSVIAPSHLSPVKW